MKKTILAMLLIIATASANSQVVIKESPTRQRVADCLLQNQVIMTAVKLESGDSLYRLSYESKGYDYAITFIGRKTKEDFLRTLKKAGTSTTDFLDFDVDDENILAKGMVFKGVKYVYMSQTEGGGVAIPYSKLNYLFFK